MPSSPEFRHAKNWEKAVPFWRLARRIPELIYWKNSIQANQGKSQRRQILSGNFYNHIRARDIKNCILSRQWRTYYKFCCERNPWDKLLSRYAWRYAGRDKLLPDAISPELMDEFLTASLAETPSLSDYDCYTNKQGQVILDKIIRYEKLNEDLAEVCNHLGIEFDGELKELVKVSSKNSSLSYRDVFSPKQRDLITSACKNEIKLFGYEY